MNNASRPAVQLLPVALLILLCGAVANLAADPPEGESQRTWQLLFDGKTLEGWKVTQFGGEGDVYVEAECLHFEFGSPLTGVTYAGENLPRTNYELQLEAQRIEGTDFFCGLTFPIEDAHLSLILGGWGGALVGLSSLDGRDASDNESRRSMTFRKQTWYDVRTQVTPERVRVWIDEQLVIDQPIQGRRLSLRPEVELSTPLGICSFETRAAYRNIRIRRLP